MLHGCADAGLCAHKHGAMQETPSLMLRELERAENFPVALRVLPALPRRQLGSIYDVARVIDDLGDRGPAGDRTARLLAFRRDLDEVWTTGQPASPVLQRLVPTVREAELIVEPF